MYTFIFQCVTSIITSYTRCVKISHYMYKNLSIIEIHYIRYRFFYTQEDGAPQKLIQIYPN